jgi:hypothetical protein
MNQFESNVPLEKLGTSVTQWLKIKLQEKKPDTSKEIIFLSVIIYQDKYKFPFRYILL